MIMCDIFMKFSFKLLVYLINDLTVGLTGWINWTLNH